MMPEGNSEPLAGRKGWQIRGQKIGGASTPQGRGECEPKYSYRHTASACTYESSMQERRVIILNSSASTNRQERQTNQPPEPTRHEDSMRPVDRTFCKGVDLHGKSRPNRHMRNAAHISRIYFLFEHKWNIYKNWSR